MARTLEDFVSSTEFAGGDIHRLAGDASTRSYARVVLGERSAMVMDTPPVGENFPAFVEIAQHLVTAGYSAPKILARDMEEGFLLLEDFGNDSFTKVLSCHPALVAGSEDIISSDNCSPSPRYKNGVTELMLYEAAVDLLAEWLKLPLPNLPAYNNEVYLREVSLFPDWFLAREMGAEKANNLRGEYLKIWEDILNSAPLAQNIFVHRDFHADNLMWLDERSGSQRVGLLDFQDGLLGDAAYDLVSLLEDARRDTSEDLRQKMIGHYLKQTGAQAEDFLAAYNVLGAQRNSKIIGIFTRLAVRDGKQHYLQYMPRVWAHLNRDLQHPLLAPIKGWMEKNIPAELRQ